MPAPENLSFNVRQLQAHMQCVQASVLLIRHLPVPCEELDALFNGLPLRLQRGGFEASRHTCSPRSGKGTAANPTNPPPPSDIAVLNLGLGSPGWTELSDERYVTSAMDTTLGCYSFRDCACDEGCRDIASLTPGL
ncbi:uncharacterized protein ColSpa_04439 [Colletotrichum spaethianum]|uniref:Uncharacterized protein n=1 Tax=Colletotrichum spaethianum TaxID=700344 RepID=A0AA37P100_9PEZI|nr:uncharacterized protein ColSpa_04439 [Colletotrichum spaethianum]GKT44258.1 hypothetical protein ColSpa_04439 [Colletotrichum spaethianum]